jgi:hypothetical protein
MGLDMYAHRVKSEDAIDTFTIAKGEDGMMKVEDLFYWRKHHDLHGWMERLYQEKGGQDTFNCRAVQLTLEDLKRLEQDLKSNQLPETTGFFFGNNPPDKESIKYDMKFIRAARKAIKEGDAVYYDSWW